MFSHHDKGNPELDARRQQSKLVVVMVLDAKSVEDARRHREDNAWHPLVRFDDVREEKIVPDPFSEGPDGGH